MKHAGDQAVDRADEYRFSSDERRPIEILVFSVDPEHLDEFLRVDHEVWTLGEAFMPGLDRIPFLSKEVWIDESRPGEVTLVFVWDTMAEWDTVADADFQARLQAEFDARFPHRCELVRAVHDDSGRGLFRVSRFERAGQGSTIGKPDSNESK